MESGGVDVSASSRRWGVLVTGFLAMAAGCSFQYGVPYLVPALRAGGLSLADAGLIVSCPIAGLLLTLLAWGAAADRWGERLVLSAGLGLAGVVLLAGAVLRGTVALGGCFLVAGAASASVHAASGRLILGWFAAHERGKAMAVRQTAQPIGVATAALTLPVLAARSTVGARVLLGALCACAALLVVLVVRDPPRPATGPAGAGGSPYRTPVLWKVHGVSALLVVPQFAVATYGLVYLVDERGWGASAAGRLLAAAQVGAALARLAAGYWSDRVGGRLRPLRVLAAAIAVVIAGLAVGMVTGSVVATGALALAAVVSASSNGLAFTAVAEYAGPTWAGRALGAQNTVQNAVAVASPPLLGSLIGARGYGAAFAAVVAFPLLAVTLVPVSGERGPAVPARRPGTAGSAPAPTDAGG